MLPKIRSVFEAAEMIEFIETSRCEFGIERSIPCHLLIETHGALVEEFELAALPGVESLSFGLMDFIVTHNGAIPDSAMRSPGQFDHPLVRRAKLEIAAACHAHGKVPSHNVTTEVRDTNSASRACGASIPSRSGRSSKSFRRARMKSFSPPRFC